MSGAAGAAGAADGGNPNGAAGAAGGAGAGGAAGAGNPGGGSGASGGGVPSWQAELNANPDLSQYWQSKGSPTVPVLLESYRNLEKLRGVPAERLLELPNRDDDVEGWKAVHKKLGAPEKPEDYSIAVPKEGGDPEFAKFAQKMFHDAGLSKKQAEHLVKNWNEYGANGMKAREAASTAKQEASKKELSTEWGAAYEQNINIAAKAAEDFGLSVEDCKAIENSIGFGKMFKFFHAIGSKIGEHQFVDGGGSGGGAFKGQLTPAQAKAREMQLRSDPSWVERYMRREGSAVEEMQKLLEAQNQMA